MYGDTVEEIDWSVGRILDTLDELGIARNTLVFFSSDNGPWLTYDDHGGSAGLLRMGKGSTWEGGMRVPGIFRQPGTVKPDIIREIGATMDLLPTFAAMADAKPPADRVLDGYDLGGVLTGKASKSPRNEIFFYRAAELWAVRMGPWKAHYRTKSGYLDDPLLEHDPPLLFNLEIDPSEKYNVAAEHADVLKQITELVERHRKTLSDPLPDHLAARGD
jgi:arylsulfatase A-like enzyme